MELSVLRIDMTDRFPVCDDQMWWFFVQDGISCDIHSVSKKLGALYTDSKDWLDIDIEPMQKWEVKLRVIVISVAMT